MVQSFSRSPFRKLRLVHTRRKQLEPSDSNVPNRQEHALLTRLRTKLDFVSRMKRIPIGFYITIESGNVNRRTSNKNALLHQDMIEWDDDVYLPSDRSSKVCFTMIASFELGSTLGHGEPLQMFETTVGELLDHDTDSPIKILEHGHEDERSVGTLEIEIKQQVCDWDRYVTSITMESKELELEELTDMGHTALARFRDTQEQAHLDESVGNFERAQDICPPKFPDRATVLFNLANAKVICYRLNGLSSNLDVAIELYRAALDLRPPDHLEHPLTLLSLGIALHARSQRRQDRTDEAEARNLLSNILNVFPDYSYTYLATLLTLCSMATKPCLIALETSSQTASTGDNRKNEKLELDPLDTLFYVKSDTVRDLVDTERAVAMLQCALQHIPDNHPDKASCKYNCADLFVFLCRFDDIANLDKSLSLIKCALELTPDGDRNRAGFLRKMGYALFARYERLGDVVDLEKAISVEGEALQLIPHDDPDRAVQLGNLALSLSARYERLGDRKDLEEAISMEEEALRLAPGDDTANKALRLGSLARTLFVRYERFHDAIDLEKLIPMEEEALQLTSDDDPYKVVRIGNLARSFFSCYERFGNVTDLKRSIVLGEEALRLVPHDDEAERASRLGGLAMSLYTRYERFHDVNDLETSISMEKEALELTPDGDPFEALLMGNLARSLSSRYERFGDVNDLRESILMEEKLLQLTPQDDEINRAMRLGNLAVSLSRRYERFGNEVDLEKSISMETEALRLTSRDDPDRVLRLGNLAMSLSASYERFSKVADLEKSIEMGEEALRLVPPDDKARRTLRLGNLARSLSRRYERFGNVNDLEKAMSMEEEALRLTSHDDPDRALRLGNLAMSLYTRYNRFGDVADLEKSIQIGVEVLQLVPNDDKANKAVRLTNLAKSLTKRYERFGNVDDLKKSISLEEEALQLVSLDDPHRALRLGNLAMTLFSRYERFGDMNDLEKSMSMEEEVLRLIPRDDEANRSFIIGNLARSLFSRYERFGNVVDLDRSIFMEEEALKLTSYDDPDRALRLGTLAKVLSARYKRFGKPEDLENSISKEKEAVLLTPHDDMERAPRLGNLANSLNALYNLKDQEIDLNESISMDEEALQLTPLDDPDRALRLGNLAMSLSSRFEHFTKLMDQEEPEESRPPTPHDDLEDVPQGTTSSFTRSRRFAKVMDLQKSIQMKEEALELTPEDDPSRARRLISLARSLLTRHKHLGMVIDLSELEEMAAAAQQPTERRSFRISQLRRVGVRFVKTRTKDVGKNASTVGGERELDNNSGRTKMTATGKREKVGARKGRHRDVGEHTIRPHRPTEGLVGLLEWFRDSSSSDLPRAIQYSSRAAHSVWCPISDRFQASLQWKTCVLEHHPHDTQALLDAFTVSIDLLPQTAWVGSSLEDRLHHLLQAPDVVCDAAAAALEANLPDLAVEWLEQGRSIMWSQLYQLRAPADDLRIAHPDLATQFEHLSQKLEGAGAQDRGMNILADFSDKMDGSSESQPVDYSALAVKRDRLLAEIRSLSGFERFLLRKTIDQLSTLAHAGPVVFLNAGLSRCDALIVMAGSEHVVHVPLSDISYDEVKSMRKQLAELLDLHGRIIRVARDCSESSRGARPAGKEKSADDVFQSILSHLWYRVVRPILDAAGFTVCVSLGAQTRRSTSDQTPASGPNLPRIFWCPSGTFSFLPIHAAGCYGNVKGGKVSDFVVSSYVPTMTVFQPPAQKDSGTTLRSGSIRLLAVRQPSTDGGVPLRKAPKEIEMIRELANSSSSVDFQEADGTVEDVMEKMTRSDWVHFACHGRQDPTNPLDSGIALADRRRLKLSDLARMTRQTKGGLAFLSACQTATGDENLSEEAIHVAAGMLLAGYEGAIATMWSIYDEDGLRVTKSVYEYLVRDEVPESGQAAEALHHAIDRLRESGASFLSWVPFIHVGQ